MFQFLNKLQINSPVIIILFLLSLIAYILNTITGGKANKLFFSTYRTTLFDPLLYVRSFTHILGHTNWSHFMNNFLYILLVGPMIEEKYGSMNLLYMILITALITSIINMLISKNALLGASGIVFMLIVLGSFVNIQDGKIPVTLILIFIFYIVNEIISGIFKKDNVSHLGHLIGAVCGFIFGTKIF